MLNCQNSQERKDLRNMFVQNSKSLQIIALFILRIKKVRVQIALNLKIVIIIEFCVKTKQNKMDNYNKVNKVKLN